MLLKTSLAIAYACAGLVYVCSQWPGPAFAQVAQGSYSFRKSCDLQATPVSGVGPHDGSVCWKVASAGVVSKALRVSGNTFEVCLLSDTLSTNDSGGRVTMHYVNGNPGTENGGSTGHAFTAEGCQVYDGPRTIILESTSPPIGGWMIVTVSTKTP